MIDIVARLRSRSPYLKRSSAERIMAEAAAEIERLRALAAIVREQGFEIERLREHVEALRLAATSHEPEALRLQDEIERLRAALQQIIGRYETTKDDWPADEVMTAMVVMARAAVEHKP